LDYFDVSDWIDGFGDLFEANLALFLIYLWNRKRADYMVNTVCVINVIQKLITKAFSFTCTFFNAGNIR
jgi:hypothetical protein